MLLSQFGPGSEEMPVTVVLWPLLRVPYFPSPPSRGWITDSHSYHLQCPRKIPSLVNSAASVISQDREIKHH